MKYDATLFCDLIDNLPQIKFLRDEEKFGFRFRAYQGVDGNLVLIDCDDDNFSDELGISYLYRLGLADKVLAMYNKSEPAIAIQLEPVMQENHVGVGNCSACNGIGQINEAPDVLVACTICSGTGSV